MEDQSHADLSLNGQPPNLDEGDASLTMTPPRTGRRISSISQLITSGGSGALATPGPSKPGSSYKAANNDINTTPVASRRPSAAGTGGLRDKDDGYETQTPFTAKNGKGVTNLTLREQEKLIDSIKKENFSLKLKITFLEDRLTKMAPDQFEDALKQNTNLKTECQTQRKELKDLNRKLAKLEKELELMRKASESSRSREEELEELLEERDRELREWRRRKSGGADDQALRDAEERNAELEEQLQTMRAVMEENLEEIDQLKDELLQKGNVSMSSDGGETRRARLERKLAEVEDENEELRARHEDDGDIIRQHEEDVEILQDEIERLKNEMEVTERRREAETMERSESRAMILEEREEREALQADLDSVRDQLAATTLELQQREDDLELKCRDYDELMLVHQQDLDDAEAAWRGELEELRGQNEELRDVIAENDTELRELRGQLEEQDNVFRQLENAIDVKEEEIKASNRDIEKLSQHVFELENEVERLVEENERVKEEAAVDRESLESVAAALKEKIVTAKAQLQEVSNLYEQCREEIVAHRARQEELAQHAEALAAELQVERDQREQLDNELDTLERHREDDERKHRRAIEDKEAELRSALNDASRFKTLLAERDTDMAALQAAVTRVEDERRQLGESHTNDKFSLELEVDRLKRDLGRAEDDLNRARAELADREAQYRERDALIDRLHTNNRDLTAEVATQTQARLNATERLDSAQTRLRDAETELHTLRSKVNDLEKRLNSDQKALLANENTFRDQLTERNTLLLTIYQYMEKILGSDKIPRKSGSETKPYTNFAVFHENLMSRLKALSHVQMEFDKRTKDVEARLTENYNALKKKMDGCWRQIDNQEKAVKSAQELKSSWRKKYMEKQGEIEAAQASANRLKEELAALRAATQTKLQDTDRRSSTGLNSADRRAGLLSNQLRNLEDARAKLQERYSAAESRWELRVKEYEQRIKQSDERVKRERQGAKERVAELENHIKTLQKQIEEARKHGAQLGEIVEKNKAASGGRS
ncbi:hypothetical protein M422DRAFT_240378 [Sphaerobolus stellatus SS14]|nr:hypothetical protein M422DRAFT_240378 [Sphaerobolus stellatus SS14]